MMLSFMSFFVMLIVPLLVVIFIRGLSKYIQHKRAPWIFGIYSLILLSAVLVLPLLSANYLLNDESISGKSSTQDKVSQDFYDAAAKGQLDQVKGVTVSKEWSFDYGSDKLEIAEAEGEYYGTNIVAERKTIDDDKIEVFHYRVKGMLDSLNIPKDIKSPRVTLEGNKLIIARPEHYEITFVRFKKDFTISQFLGGQVYGEMYGFRDRLGPQVLYLRIPKNLQINDLTHNLQFVEKN